MPHESNSEQTVKVMALCRYAAVGPRLFELLISRYGGIDGVFRASRASLQDISGLSDDAVDRITRAEQFLTRAGETIDTLAARDIRVVSRLDGHYPNLLNELNDPPPLLYVRGKLPCNEGKAVVLVGATEATIAGIELTVQVARRFAESSAQIVSSLRMGIDAAVHLGARAANHDSFAVVESGFDHLLATDQLPVAIDALSSGGVISEYAPETAGTPSGYIQANRLLVGLGHAVVITEVYKKSREVLDLVEFCGQIGKLVFILTHPSEGALSDDETLETLAENGAIPMHWPDDFDKIVAALV